jgi:hypothetical protein
MSSSMNSGESLNRKFLIARRDPSRTGSVEDLLSDRWQAAHAHA